MDERQSRAWRALGLGPIWRLRAQTRPEASPRRADRSVRPVAQTADDPGANPADGPAAESTVNPWPVLRAEVSGCHACGLARTRTRTVFGSGNAHAQWVFVGEAPGAEEDRQGEPFVGPAGQLLDQMLAAIEVDRGRDAFVANVLKCRPPGNRDPAPEEVRSCSPFLHRQIALLSAKVVVALGRFAAQSLLQTDASLSRLRGRVHRYTVAGRHFPLVVTFHPAYLLRNPADKALAWADLCLARDIFDAETPNHVQTPAGPH